MSEAVPTTASNELISKTASATKKTLYPCQFCGHIFNQSCNLSRHTKEVHKIKMVFPPKEFQCYAYGCERSYTSKPKLQTHVVQKHPKEAAALQEEFKRRSKIVCPVSECVEHCLFRDELRKHIVDVHALNIEKIDLTFPTREEFMKWKVEVEKEECTYYRKPCAKTAVSRDPNNVKFVEHFWCHRSGEYICEAKDVNNPKKTCRRSVKIGKTCPAAMKVLTTSDSPLITVTFWKPHIGHGPDPPFNKNLPKPPKPERKKRKRKCSEIDGSPPSAKVKNKTSTVPSLHGAVKTSRPSKAQRKEELSKLYDSVACNDNKTVCYDGLLTNTELVLNEVTVTTSHDPVLNEVTGEFEGEVVNVPDNLNQVQTTLDLDTSITVTPDQQLVFLLDTKSVLQRSTNSVQNVPVVNVSLAKPSDVHKFGVKKRKMLNRVEALLELVKAKNDLSDVDYSRVMNKINECFANLSNSH